MGGWHKSIKLILSIVKMFLLYHAKCGYYNNVFWFIKIITVKSLFKSRSDYV